MYGNIPQNFTRLEKKNKLIILILITISSYMQHFCRTSVFKKEKKNMLHLVKYFTQDYEINEFFNINSAL